MVLSVVLHLLLVCSTLALANARSARYVLYPTHSASLPPSAYQIRRPDAHVAIDDTDYRNESIVKSSAAAEAIVYDIAVPSTAGRLNGHYIRLDDVSAFSIVEPVAGCGRGRTTVADTARHHGCAVAVNAGFFAINRATGDCLNAVVSDGALIQEQARHRDGRPIEHRNVHFGVTDKGEYFVGYVDEDTFALHCPAKWKTSTAAVSVNDSRNCGGGVSNVWRFAQLVGGVGWLVRDRKEYITSSWKSDEDRTTPVPSDSFVQTISARAAIGHDDRGRLVMLAVDGKTDVKGVSLVELSHLLISFGVVNAINLDGGGSATVVVNGETVNYPSDECSNEYGVPMTTCQRPVTTVACIRRRHDTRADNSSSSALSAAAEDVETRLTSLNEANDHLRGALIASVSAVVILLILIASWNCSTWYRRISRELRRRGGGEYLDVVPKVDDECANGLLSDANSAGAIAINTDIDHNGDQSAPSSPRVHPSNHALIMR